MDRECECTQNKSLKKFLVPLAKILTLYHIHPAPYKILRFSYLIARQCYHIPRNCAVRMINKIRAFCSSSINPCVELLSIIGLYFICKYVRNKPKETDIILGPEPLINNIYHKKALEKFGYTVETVVFTTYFITQEFDVDFSKKYSKLFNRSKFRSLFYIKMFLYIIFRCKCIYIYFNGGPFGFLSNKSLLKKLEPYFFKLANVKVVVMPYGGDVQDMQKNKNLLYKFALGTDYPMFHTLQKKTFEQVNRWTKGASHIISGCDWVDYNYYWDTLMLAHFSIDTNRWSYHGPSKNKDGIYRILHAPNHRCIKGTKFFIAAVEELKKEGFPVELVILEKKHNSEIFKAIREADIIADQLVVGWYAMFAIEAMASGKPVLCYLREDYLNLYEFAGLLNPNEMPIINCTYKNVKEKIKDLITQPSKLEEIGRKSREFVLKHHSLEVIGQKFDVINKSLNIDASIPRSPSNHELKAPTPFSADTLRESLEKVKELAPKAYSVWEKCQREGEKAYIGYSIDSCSVDGHAQAARFRSFINPYLRGTVLDIGCGPQPMPSYLADYPPDLIAGIDPILAEPHPFVFAKGIAEFLPWADQSFDVVVVGTSLDHAILLDRVYDEIQRVLKPGGNCLIWVGFTPSAFEYKPYSNDLVPYDKFHLFHFNRPWFEKSISQNFEISRVNNFKSSNVIYEAFYALKVRH